MQRTKNLRRINLMLERKNLENNLSTRSFKSYAVVAPVPKVEESREQVKEEDEEEFLEEAEPSQRFPVKQELKELLRAKLEEDPGKKLDTTQALERLKEKLELKTMGNYRKVLQDIRGALNSDDPDQRLMIGSNQILKKLSIFKP